VPKNKRKGPGLAQTMGGILAGFDQQVFRTTPPPHELVQKGARLPAVPAEGGGTLSIELPDDAVVEGGDEPTEATDPPTT
jgi:hypothetical protein